MAATGGTSVGFVTLVIFSLLSHLTELILSALLAFTLSYDVTQRDVFFPLTSGLLILPLVLLQLASAVSLLRRRGDRMTSWEAGVMAVLHVLQLGFVWRHLALLKGNHRSNSSSNSSSLGIAISSNSNNSNYVNRRAAGGGRGKPTDLSDLLTLRLIFTFAGGFPLMVVELYLTVKGTWQTVPWPWALYGAMASSVLSSVWALSSYQRRVASHLRHFRPGCPSCEEGSSGSATTSTTASTAGSGANAEGTQLMSWPGSLFRIVWRGGELVSRVISLTLFACLYGPWVLLVLALHWLVMLLSLSLPQTLARGPRPSARESSAALSSFSSSSSSCTFRRAACCLLTSYAFVFAYVNTSRRRRRAAVWYTLYYVIMFLENGTLSIVWLTKSPAEGFTDKYLLVFISTLAYLAAMVCLCVYYKYFHLHAASFTASCQHHPRGGDADNKSTGMPVNGCCVGDLNSCRSGISNACGTNHLDHRHHNGLEPYPNGLHGPDSASRWLSQHHSTVTAGQCCKRESLLGSLSDLASLTTAGSLCGVGRAPRRTPKMGLGGSASTSLDSVVGVGLRRGADGLAPRNCCGGCCYCCCSGDHGPGEADAASVVTCQTSTSAPGCPHTHHQHPNPLLQPHQHTAQHHPHYRHPHHHHLHHHHHHSLQNGGASISSSNNNTGRRCPHQKSCCRSDLTDTTSVLTLTSVASHNLGYEGSDETHSNSVPAWLPRGESFIAKHLLSSAPGQGGHGKKGEPQEKHLDNYRQILRQEANRWAGDTTNQSDVPTPASHKAESAASWEGATKQQHQQQQHHQQHRHPHHHQQQQRQPQGQNALVGEEEEMDQKADSDSGQCCRCYELSPGDAEVSSIFKTAHLRTRSERCRLHDKPGSPTPVSSGIDGCDSGNDDDDDDDGGGGDGDGGDRAGIPASEGEVTGSVGIQTRKGRDRKNLARHHQSQSTHHHQHHPPQPKQQHKPRRSKREQLARSVEPDQESVPAGCTCVDENAPEDDPRTDEFPNWHQAGSSRLPPVYGSAKHGQRHAHHRTKRRTGASGDPESSRTQVPVHSDAKASSKSMLEKYSVSNEQRANARAAELRDDSEATSTFTHPAVESGIHRKDSRDDLATVHKAGRRSEKRRHARDEELVRSSPRRSVSSDRLSDSSRASRAERQTVADSGGLERAAVTDMRASHVEHVPSKLQVKAIAARFDEEDRPTSAARAVSSSCSSPDPVYENVLIRPLPSVNVKLPPTFAENKNAGSEFGLKSDTKDEFKLHESLFSRDNKDTKSKPYADEEILTSSELYSEKLTIHDDYPLKSENRVRNKRERTDYQPSRSTEKGVTSAHPHYSSTSGRRTDSWYLCSESEDSALPPETFSSSVDDGVSDVGSDISFEFVI